MKQAFNRYVRMLSNFILNKKERFHYLNKAGFYAHMSDKAFLEKRWKVEKGYTLDWNNLKTYNEKIQWQKLYDHRPEYTIMADKYRVREYVKKIIGEEFLIPLIGVWDTPDEIDFAGLPNQFVLKCNHNSGTGMCICKDKKSLNIDTVKAELKKGLKEDYYIYGREWSYKNIKRKIICEQYMEDESGKELKDYKIFCFNGEPKLIQVDFDRFILHKRNLYSLDWEYINGEIEFPTDPNHIINKPITLDLMLGIAKKLSEGFPHVRVDLYSIYDKVYFGELTLYHGSGYERFSPDDFENEFSSWWI